jgi:hypothetical protein
MALSPLETNPQTIPQTERETDIQTRKGHPPTDVTLTTEQRETDLHILNRAVPTSQFKSKVGHLVDVRPFVRVGLQHVP